MTDVTVTQVRPGPSARGTAGVLLLAAGVIGVLLLVIAPDYGFAETGHRLGQLVDGDSNRPFFTFIVCTGMAIALVGAGGSAAGAAAGNVLGTAAGATAAIASAVLLLAPIVRSAQVLGWSQVPTEGNALTTINALHFGATLVGHGVLVVALLLLAAATLASRTLPRMLAVVPALLALVVLFFVIEGEHVGPLLAPIVAIVLGGALLGAGLLPRSGSVDTGHDSRQPSA